MINKLLKNFLKDLWTPPGTITQPLTPQPVSSSPAIISNFVYSFDNFHRNDIRDLIDLKGKINLIKTPQPNKGDLVNWIDIVGLHDIDLIKALGEEFNIHPLVLEDIVGTHQRPKLEDWDDYIYAVVKMLYWGVDNQIIHEQVSFILGPNYLISFQEQKGDVFSLIRNRLQSGKGRIRKMGADYLMYSLIDAITDNYFVVLDKFGDKIETLGEAVELEPTVDNIRKVQKFKHDILIMRSYAVPLREVVITLAKSESDFIKDSTLIYLKDLQDHIMQITESIEILRDVAISTVETSRSTLNNKMNEIMKVLTIVSTIFMPLTFIVGIYGMNFHYMPELEWKWAYPAVMLLTLLIAIFMLIFFKKKNWL